MTKEYIKKIQTELKNLSLYKDTIDGIYGINTRLAIASFQRMHPPLIPDGIFGDKTGAEMFIGKIDRRTVRPSKTGKYPKQKDIRKFFGEVGENQTTIVLPYEMRLAWDERVSVNKIRCHEKVAKDLSGILQDTKNEYGIERIRLMGLDMYGGCLNVRKIRGGNSWSTHAYGIAIDIDPANNQLRTPWNQSRLSGKEYRAFWDIVYAHGAYSLGIECNMDSMHLQFAKP